MSDQPVKQAFEEVSLCDGKYLFRKDLSNYHLTCQRHGDVWREFIGDKAIGALFDRAYEVEELKKEIERLKVEKEDYHQGAIEWEEAANRWEENTKRLATMVSSRTSHGHPECNSADCAKCLANSILEVLDARRGPEQT